MKNPQLNENGGYPLSREIGSTLRDRRRRLKMSQRSLAAATLESRTAISYLETSRRGALIETVERLCVGLDATPLEIFAEADGRCRRKKGD